MKGLVALLVIASFALSNSPCRGSAVADAVEDRKVDIRRLLVQALSGDKASREELGREVEGEHVPYLSVVVILRNDDYGGRLLDRFQLSISTLASLALVHSLRMELIVIEWDPPPDALRLLNATEWPSALQDVTIVTVNPAELDVPSCRGWEYEGKNLGVSLARGRFILTTNCDILFTEPLVRFLAEGTLGNDSFYRVDRHDVLDPVPPTMLQLGAAAMERHCEQHSIRRLRRYGLVWHPMPDGPSPHVESQVCLVRRALVCVRACVHVDDPCHASNLAGACPRCVHLCARACVRAVDGPLECRRVSQRWPWRPSWRTQMGRWFRAWGCCTTRQRATSC